MFYKNLINYIYQGIRKQSKFSAKIFIIESFTKPDEFLAKYLSEIL